jgi:5-formyltetrahydrofolate cyclo-ligase
VAFSASDDPIAARKSALRTAALARRDALPAAERQAGAETIATRAFPVAIAPGMIVAGFMPMKSEINPLPLMRKLAEQGAQLALPAID